MDRDEIVEVLEQIAVLLELKGENAFKIRAYQNGARALSSMEEDLGEAIEAGDLAQMPGFGKALVDKVTTLYEEGSLEFYDKLVMATPSGLLEMLEIPGLGGKKIKVLHQELGLESIEALKAACEDGRVAGLKGFGKKTAEKILNGIANRKAYGARHLWWNAQAVAHPLLEALRALPAVERAEAAGSLRRRRETVGDLDFIAASEDPEPVMDWFVHRPEVEQITAQGSTKSSVRLTGGLQADLRVVPPRQFAYALHHFTGSKDHNVRMRQRALSRGLSLSEWGLEPTDKDSEEQRNPREAADEAALFEHLGLRYIPPELREDSGEIEWAGGKEPLKLIEYEDIRGVFHNHTRASDGRNTLEEMVEAAEARGWEYLGLADHSKASVQANGLDEERLTRQIEQIHALNQSNQYRCHVFTGVECDILPDGSLDLEDSILEKLDYVVASVHSAMGQAKDTMTRRLIRALEHPCTTMLGHPTGRLLLQRESSQVDLNQVIDAAIANGKIIELNANPRRLELDWRLLKRAADKGMKTSINPDAHAVDHFDFVELGVACARKAWLSPQSVLNTLPLTAILKELGKDN